MKRPREGNRRQRKGQRKDGVGKADEAGVVGQPLGYAHIVLVTRGRECWPLIFIERLGEARKHLTYTVITRPKLVVIRFQI